MTDDSTDRLVQLALNVTDLFDADLQMVGRAEQNSIEVARIRVHALLSSLAPELRDAVNSSFGLDGGVTVADHQDLIGASPGTAQARTRGRRQLS